MNSSCMKLFVVNACQVTFYTCYIQNYALNDNIDNNCTSEVCIIAITTTLCSWKWMGVYVCVSMLQFHASNTYGCKQVVTASSFSKDWQAAFLKIRNCNPNHAYIINKRVAIATLLLLICTGMNDQEAKWLQNWMIYVGKSRPEARSKLKSLPLGILNYENNHWSQECRG